KQRAHPTSSDGSKMLPALVRSSQGVKLINISANESVVKSLIRICNLTNVSSKCFLKRKNVIDSKLHVELLREETKRVDFSKGFAFGVLYAKDDQVEDEIYANNEITPAFDRFMHLLGDTVSLNGFKGLKAGLDITSTLCTGTHSVYTQFNQYQIMFHVAPMLPFDPFNDQQIPRKKHIGNDLVVIIFREGNSPFNPSLLRSHMNQAFLLVKEITYDEACTLLDRQGTEDQFTSPMRPSRAASTGSSENAYSAQIHLNPATAYYQLAFAAKTGNPLCTPLLIRPAVVSADQLRALILTKCINAHRNAFGGDEIAPIFRRMWSEQVISFHNLFFNQR
ncbi:MAG: GTPase-activating protein, partial [archaeon]|nr:GTPase-activating protein [archaeon]